MTDEVAGRLSAAEMQQYMTDDALRSLAERLDAADREIADMRQKHHEEMAVASAALDAAMAEIERLREELGRR